MVNHSHGVGPHPRLRADYRIPAIEKYAYCLCLHVKPTTIFIAVFKLIRALLFASILLNTEFAVSEHSDLGLAVDSGHKSTAAAVNILARIIMASVSAVGIYAVISGRAALLMPLYAILLVDFFFSLPAFYNRESDPAFSDNISDLRGYSSQANNQYTRYSIMLFSTLLMIIKIYFLCVIWKCYRYLRLIELVSPMIYPPFQGVMTTCPINILGQPDQDLTDAGVGGNNIAPPAYESIASSMKPPNYEEAMKATSPSPTYSTTTATLSQQQPVVLTSINPDQQSSIQYEHQFNPQVSSSVSTTIATNSSSDIPISNTSPSTTGAPSYAPNQVTTSTVQTPQDMTESATHHSASESTLEKSPSIVIVDSNESRDKH